MPQAIPLAVYAAVAQSSVQYAAFYAMAASAAASIAVSRYTSNDERKKTERRRPDNKVTVRSSVTPRRVVYGRAMLGGTIAFAHSEGDNNNTMHLIIPICEGEIDAIEEIYLNERPFGMPADPTAGGYATNPYFSQTNAVLGGAEAMPDASGNFQFVNLRSDLMQIVSCWATIEESVFDYGSGTSQTVQRSVDIAYTYDPVARTVVGNAGAVTGPISLSYTYPEILDSFAWCRVYRGTSNQAADPDLRAVFAGLPTDQQKWTTDHRLIGTAYVYLRLRYQKDIFATGLPAIKFLVRGKKVFDPRNGQTAWSENWALCVRDYLTSFVGLSASDINDTYVIAEANICAESVLSAGRPNNAEYKITQLRRNIDYEHRYEMNGAVDLTEAPLSVLEGMMEQVNGMLTLTEGQFVIRSGHYSAPAVINGVPVTLTESDLAGAPKIVRNTPNDQLFNAVRGTYAGAEQGYTTVDATAYRSAGYKLADGGKELWAELNLPMCRTNSEAQRVFRGKLELSRRQMTVELECNLKQAFLLSAGDICYLTLARHGFLSKTFRVMKWSWTKPNVISLSLREEDAAWDSWNTIDAADTPPPLASRLPNPFARPTITGLLVQSGGAYARVRAEGQVSQGARVFWNASSDPNVRNNGRIELDYRQPHESTWTSAGYIDGSTNATLVEPLLTGALYTFRVRAINAIGVTGEYSYVSAVITGPAVRTAITGYLTNESSTVAADPAGVVNSFTGTGGQFKVFSGAQDVTELCTFSVVSPVGVTIAVSNTAGQKGAYSISALSTDTGSATLRAMYGTNTIEKVYSISKSRAGGAPSSYWISGAVAIARSASNTYTPSAITFSAFTSTPGNAPVLYAGRWTVDASDNGTTFTNVLTSSVNESSRVFTPSGATLKLLRVRLYAAGGTTALLDETLVPVVVDGALASSGLAALTPIITNSSHVLPADTTGGVQDYTGSGTQLRVFEGTSPLTYAASNPQAGQFTVGPPVVLPANAITPGTFSSSGSNVVTVDNGALMFSGVAQVAALAAADAAVAGSKKLAYSLSWRNSIGTNPALLARRNGTTVWQAAVNGTLTVSGNNLVIPSTVAQLLISSADITTGTWTLTIANGSDSSIFITVSLSAPGGSGYAKFSSNLSATGTVTIGSVTIYAPTTLN